VFKCKTWSSIKIEVKEDCHPLLEIALTADKNKNKNKKELFKGNLYSRKICNIVDTYTHTSCRYHPSRAKLTGIPSL
jgi:hypothetical protein